MFEFNSHVNSIKKNQLYLLLIFLIIITVINITFINYSIIYGNENSNPSLTVNEGIASGDVTHESAIIWSRVNKPSIMHVEYANNSLFLNSKLQTKWIDNTTDFTGHVKLIYLQQQNISIVYFFQISIKI